MGLRGTVCYIDFPVQGVIDPANAPVEVAESLLEPVEILDATDDSSTSLVRAFAERNTSLNPIGSWEDISRTLEAVDLIFSSLTL